jgi:hypothetical protein
MLCAVCALSLSLSLSLSHLLFLLQSEFLQALKALITLMPDSAFPASRASTATSSSSSASASAAAAASALHPLLLAQFSLFTQPSFLDALSSRLMAAGTTSPSASGAGAGAAQDQGSAAEVPTLCLLLETVRTVLSLL